MFRRACSASAFKAGCSLIKRSISTQELSTTEIVLKIGCNIVVAPISLFAGWVKVKPNHRGVVTSFGKYRETISEGTHFRSPVGFSWYEVFVGNRSQELPKTKIVDQNGNPIVVSGTVNYSIDKAEDFIFGVNGDTSYLKNQAEIVLKTVASEYPYESQEESCLIREGKLISNQMKNELQNLVHCAGISVKGFSLTDISYSPEIAQQMLIRQRALAYIDAKDTIATASVGIINKIINDVEEKTQVVLTNDQKGKLINDLLVVMTGESGAQPVINVYKSVTSLSRK